MKVEGVDKIGVTYGETIQGSDGVFRKFGVTFDVKIENASLKEASDIYLKIQENLVSLIDKAKAQVVEGD